MLYVQQSLGPDEQLVFIGVFHWMYTVTAFMAVVWGILGAIFFLVASVFLHHYFGYLPEEMGWIESVRNLHPGLRIFAFVIFMYGLLRFAQMMVQKATTEIAITSNRLIYKRGLIARQVGEISIDRIEGVNVLQTILGRIFNYGRLAIRGMGIGEVVLPPIEQPIVFRQAIERARSL